MEKIKPIYLVYALILIIIGGTCGYYFIEGWSLIDSFFMTMITITTVGYREVGGDLSTAGKLFTVVLIISGFGVAYIALSGLAALFIRGEFNAFFGRMRMQKELKNLTDHYIIAGYGRTGQVISSHLKLKEIPFVVIDTDIKTLAKLREENVPFIQGDASDEDVLAQAGVKKAKGFVAVVSSDAANAFAIMTAKGMNSNLNIMARALDSQSIRKLKIAGANKVIAPYILGGLRIAHAVTHPHAADFLVKKGCKLDGLTLREGLVRDVGVIVVGIRKSDGSFSFQPSADTALNSGDHLVVMGPSPNIEKLQKESEI